MMKAIKLILVALLLFSFQNNEWSGKVVAVLDGDTIDVLHDGKAERIRLSGIDCPEKAQAFGMKAKQFTSDKVFGKTVTVKPKEVDRYGRTIADIYIDGLWLNKALIGEGLAWHYKTYSNDQSLSSAEIKAQKDSLGLWADKNRIEPWNFRKQKK